VPARRLFATKTFTGSLKQSMSAQTINPLFDIFTLVAQDRIRMLRKGEIIPASLEAGFEQLGNLDHDWVWVLESGGEIKGVLLAAPCHGTAFIWRIAVGPDVEGWSVGKLLRRFLADCRERGLKGYITIIDSSVPIQKQLQRIIERAGGTVVGDYRMMSAPTPKEFI